MPVYELQKNGKTFEVEAPTPQAAADAVGRMTASAASEPSGFQSLSAAEVRRLPPAEQRAYINRAWDEERRTKRERLPAAGGFIGGVVGGVPGAALGGATGEALRQLDAHADDGAAPTSARAAATGIATQGGIQGAIEGVGAGVTKAAGAAGRAVYRGYLKPALSDRLLPKAREIVETAINEAIPISRGGVQMGTRLIRELTQEVEGILKRSGKTVDLHGIAERVRLFAKRRYHKPGVDPSDFQAAMAVADKLDGHPALNLPPGARPTRVDVSLDAANEAKRGLDTSVRETGFGTANVGAKRTTEKHARHELNQAMQREAPAIAPLNARESKLIDATKAIAKAVEREANQNQLYGVKSLVAGAVGGGAGYTASGGDPVAAATWALAMRTGLHPAIASRAALVAARSAKELGIGAAQASRLAIMAVTSEQAADQPNQ